MVVAGLVNVLRQSNEETRRHAGGVDHSSWTRTASSSRKTMGGLQRKSCSRKALRCLRFRPLVIRALHHLEDAGEVGACIGEMHRVEDFIESTPESGRDLLQRREDFQS